MNVIIKRTKLLEKLYQKLCFGMDKVVVRKNE